MRRLALALIALALGACTAPTASPPPTADLGLRPITAAPNEAPPSATPTAPPPTLTRTPFGDALPPYRAARGAFVRVAGDGLQLNGERFSVRGLTLTHDLWAEHALAQLEADFARLQRIGANTVRLPLRDEALFADGAPIPASFARLDAVLRLAAAYDVRVILVLHADAAPAALPPTETVGTLAARYRGEPSLLMWDLRDVETAALYASVSRDEALLWLARSAARVRAADPVHPLTASWRGDALGTLACVDVVSVQMTDSVETLRRQVAALRQLSAKPLLLSAFGGAELETLRATVRAAEGDRLAGWLLNSANTPAEPFETLDALLNP